MSELPKGWITIKIDSLCAKPKQLKPEASWKFNYIDISSVDREKKLICEPSEILGSDAPSRARKIVNTGDVLVSMTRPNLNAVAKVPEKYNGQVASTGFDVLKPFLIESDWLFSVVRSQPFIDSISGTTIGALYPACKTSDIRDYEMPLPPLAEQKRIVEKLDEVLAQVDIIKARLDSIPNLLKRFRQSVLASAVSGKLTEEWRGVEKLLLDTDTQLPQSWQIKAANEVCIKVQSGSTPRNDPFNQGGTVPFLKVYNIVNQKVDFDYKPQFVTADTHLDKLKRSIAYPDDVLMNIVGPPLGKVAILTAQYPEWNLNQAITLFRANDELLISKYLYFVLCEGALVRDVMPETKGSVGQVNISLTQCRESKVPLPPLEEQKEIVRLVDQYFAFADTIEAQVKKAQARVDNLAQSILAKAFRGELVSQDPSDEPADKLLERIAKAREEAEALAKAAKKAQAAKKRAAKA